METIKQQIKSRSGYVIFECDIPGDTPSGIAVRVAIEKAVAAKHELRGANLRGANLSGCDLRGANLSGCDLRGCDLRGANLSGANLCDADLSGCDLRYADLSGAEIANRATPEQSIENLDKVRAIILDDRQRLEMGIWHQTGEWAEKTCAEETLCGTTHCLAGWLQVCSTNPDIRAMDAEMAGILSAPVAAKMFFKDQDQVFEWLKSRAYAAEAIYTSKAAS